MNVLTEEYLDALVYTKMLIFPISLTGIKNRMDYLFDCYITQRFYLELSGELRLDKDEEHFYEINVVDGSNGKPMAKILVPLTIDHYGRERFLKLPIHELL